SSALPPTQESCQWSVPCNKGKGKAKAMEDDEDEEGEATQKLKKELEDFVVLTKLMELVDSDSNKEEEEDRVCIIKKIKCKHVEEPTGTRKRKEIIELEDEEVEIVVPKTPVAGLSHQTSKPMVLVSSMPKPIPKLIIALASPVAGPSTAPIVPSSASKPAAIAALSKPAPQFKLVGTEESGALIINQATEVALTQETRKGDDDDSDDDNAAMDVDSAKCPEET
ncbi:hypothetical protein C0995_007244, partial [Termitomyces sp. Mi166